MENEHYLSEHEIKAFWHDEEIEELKGSSDHHEILHRRCEELVRSEFDMFTSVEDLDHNVSAAYFDAVNFLRFGVNSVKDIEAWRNKTLTDIVSCFLKKNEIQTEGDIFQESLSDLFKKNLSCEH
tara:strand:- start:774 stop:1148 length:375 start_codon:yes stop_codon:yes gene_type:complete